MTLKCDDYSVDAAQKDFQLRFMARWQDVRITQLTHPKLLQHIEFGPFFRGSDYSVRELNSKPANEM